MQARTTDVELTKVKTVGDTPTIQAVILQMLLACREAIVTIRGFRQALCWAFRTDNSGIITLPIICYRCIHYSGRNSSFDNFVNEKLEMCGSKESLLILISRQLYYIVKWLRINNVLGWHNTELLPVHELAVLQLENAQLMIQCSRIWLGAFPV